jgi:diacylglycerol kinase family enzyme
LADDVSAQRWLARAALLAGTLATLFCVGFALNGGIGLMLVAALGVVVMVASAYWFLARRRLVRWLALVLLLLTPIVVVWLLVAVGLLWVVLVTVGLLVLAVVSGREALRRDTRVSPMPEFPAAPARKPFIVMNPRSGGGKVARFALVEKAEALGAEVALLHPEGQDALVLAEDAVARGADLLGVAGGDGTQALVAGVAAAHDVPFLVISAGTRNHFALDLGLDRVNPVSCLDALRDDAVELHVDLGSVGQRTFVNNASFGAYASVVGSEAYRDDKTRTTLEILPDLLSRQAEPRLVAQVGDVRLEAPHAVLVSDNPYVTGDLAGMGRRTRLDSGMLGVVAVRVDDASHAVGLLRHTKDRGLTVLESPEVVVTADTGQVPAGIDGESVLLPSPVHLRVRPKALRVRVPRNRPGVPPPKPVWSSVRLRQLAGIKRRSR